MTMATTGTGPSLDWSTAGSDVWGLFLDTARSRLIDVEQAGDERNVPDMADLRAGQVPQQTMSGTAAPQAVGPNAGGNNWLLLGGIALATGAVVWFVAD